MLIIRCFSSTCRKQRFRRNRENSVYIGNSQFKNREYINSNLYVFMLTCRIFLEIAQIQIHQLIIFSFFPKQIRLFPFPVVKQRTSLVYNIKCTYLSASVCLSERIFQRLCTCSVERERMEVR